MSLIYHIIAELIGPSALLAIFPYAFIAAFPIFGIALVTKWEIDSRRRKRKEEEAD